MSNPEPFNKGRCVWTQGPRCRVWLNADGAATFEYKATRTSGAPVCSFTLFCEVGAPYQPLFAKFFDSYKITGVVDYGNVWPFVADLVKRKEGCAP